MIKRIYSFIIELYLNRSLIYELTKRDFQKQYAGSYLGFVWIFLQPLLFIGVLYMIFTLGFRVENERDGTPFVVYLVTGIISWQFFAQSFGRSSAIIQEYSFLLKKINFKLSILPIVKLISSFVPHLFFIFVAIIIAWTNGYPPTIYTLQLIYYSFSVITLLLGLSWITSSTNLFVPDVAKTVSVITQFGFWLTPIFWNISKISQEYQWIIKLNPIYYIISGYRDSIINQTWLWEKPLETLYFWIITLIILYLGFTVFERLRPHFAEVV